MFGTPSKTRVENGKKKIGNRKKKGEKYEKYEKNIMKLNWYILEVKSKECKERNRREKETQIKIRKA